MNKDVIYIEPEDDITDIIAKLENSKEDIVALVPPQKSAVMHSAVNIKLIAKTALAKNKKIVLVTSDALIIKLAATIRIPVTPNLQTAPTIPTLNTEEKATSVVEGIKEEVIEEESEQPTDEPKTKEEIKTEDDEDSKDKEKLDKKSDNKKKSKKTSDNPILGWIQEHKKTTIFSSSAFVILILVIIWALVIAPAANIIVSIRTVANNFSQSTSFTNKMEEEDSSIGKFYLIEKKIENITKTKFSATGTKNLGDKANGSLAVSASFGTIYSIIPGTITIASGSTFTYNNLKYTANETTSLSISSAEECDEYREDMTISEAKNTKCLQSASIEITASEAGTEYNIDGTGTEWSSDNRLYSIYNTEPISGGTDQKITIVQQSDIDQAKESLASSATANDKQKLLAEFNDDEIAIESSFKQSAGEIKTTPSVGEEVKEGDTPEIESTTTSTMYGIDKTKVEEFIQTKANLNDNQRIYSIKNPFIENFMASDNGYTGKLKATYLTGPEVSEIDVLEKARGKKIGEAQSIIKSISGVSSVTIERSFFWVNSIPNDSNKITINLLIEE